MAIATDFRSSLPRARVPAAMPKITHEALVTILRSDPKLLVDLVWPERQIDASSIHLTHTELVDVNLPERRADGVLLIGDEPRAPEWALVAEAQDCVDPKKRRRWPGYVTGVFGRHVCPVDLVVLTVDREVAAWAARPITAGRLPGALTFTPVVVGPDQIPRITDPEVARRSPELAVLSAVAHGDEPGAEAIALAALVAMGDLDNDRGILYVDLVFHHLAPAARALLEQLMATANYEFQSDFARKFFFEGRAEGRAEGEARGEARMLLHLIELRGIPASERDRERILSCMDCAQLERWAARVLTARTTDDLFEG